MSSQKEMAGEGPSGGAPPTVTAGPMPSNPPELEAVLMTLLAPDTFKIKQVT
jgi:hypothetical protein